MYFSAKFESMKKTLYLLLTTILLMTGCSDKKEFTLKGHIDGLTSDTLLAYYQVPEYKIDTIYCNKGTFEYTFVPDTLTVFSLLFDAEETLPIFADKGQSVEVSGKVGELTIKGEGENKLMDNILSLLRNTPEESLKQQVDSLISTNYHSFTNLYLFEKYYAHDPAPDYEQLKGLIDKQNGVIKDTPYMIELQGRLNDLHKSKSPSIQTMYGKDREGNAVKWSTIKNHYILIDLWASWHPESVMEQDSLENVLKALKKKNFLIYSVSLDLDKEAWLKASDRDTTQWRQVCDFNGWNTPIVNSQNIHRLPSNLLLDKSKRVIARDIRGQELINKVQELIRQDEEREKQRNARKRK